MYARIADPHHPNNPDNDGLYAEYRDDIEQEISDDVQNRIVMCLKSRRPDVLAELCEKYNGDIDDIIDVCMQIKSSYANRNHQQSHSLQDDLKDVMMFDKVTDSAAFRLAGEFVRYLDFDDAIDAEIKHRDEVAEEQAAGI